MNDSIIRKIVSFAWFRFQSSLHTHFPRPFRGSNRLRWPFLRTYESPIRCFSIHGLRLAEPLNDNAVANERRETAPGGIPRIR